MTQAKQIQKIQLLLNKAQDSKLVCDQEATYYETVGGDCLAVERRDQSRIMQGICLAYKEAIKILQES